MYWVINGCMLVRQRIVDIIEDRREDGTRLRRAGPGRRLVQVAGRPTKPFQGWRYLQPDAAPPDLAAGPARAGRGSPAAGAAARIAGCSACSEYRLRKKNACTTLAGRTIIALSRLSLLVRLACEPVPATLPSPEPSRDPLAQTPVRPARPRSAGRRLHRLARLSAATSNSLQPKAQTHHASSASHKSKSHHSSSVHNASHHAAHQPSHKSAAS